MDLTIIERLLGMTEQLSVLGLLLAIIYYQHRDRGMLRKQVEVKDKQLSDAIDAHIKDMKEGQQLSTTVLYEFNKLANKLKDIILQK